MRLVLRVLAIALLLGYVSSTATAEDAANAWEVRPALVGTKMPDLSFVGEDGKTFTLNDRVKEKPLILVVYRGLW